MNIKRVVMAAAATLAVVVTTVAWVWASSSAPPKTNPGYPRIDPSSAPQSAPGGPRIAIPGDTSNGISAYSHNWSGYAVVGAKGKYHNVKASWVEPIVTCVYGTPWQDASIWVGLDGDSTSNTVEQVGTESYCHQGVVGYRAWWEMYPGPEEVFSRGMLRPGDHLTAEVNRSGNVYALMIADSTERWSHTVTQTASNENDSAEVIVEAPYSDGVLPLANFHIIKVTGTTINGKPAAAAGASKVTMVTSKGIDKDTISPLTGGEAWTAIWIHV